MTGASFLLTPQSGEKLIINGFALIGAFMFLIFFASTLPFHSTEVPIIGKGMIINDVMQIWTIFNPPPPSVMLICPVVKKCLNPPLPSLRDVIYH